MSQSHQCSEKCFNQFSMGIFGDIHERLKERHAHFDKLLSDALVSDHALQISNLEATAAHLHKLKLAIEATSPNRKYVDSFPITTDELYKLLQ